MMIQPLLEKSQVEALLPQKAPMTMVDKLFFFKENHAVTGLYVTETNLFADEGKLSEPGIIEHMAQSAALYSGYGYREKNEIPPVGYIGSIKDLTIYNLPDVGDELVTEVDVVQEFMGITLVNIVAKVKDVTVAICQMKTVLANN